MVALAARRLVAAQSTVTFDNLSAYADKENGLPARRRHRKIRKMSVMQSEVFEAFRAIDIPEDKALKAATALSKRDDDVISLKSELVLQRWTRVVVLAFQIVVFVKLFIH